MYGKSGNRKRFQGFPYFLAKQCGKFREINQTWGDRYAPNKEAARTGCGAGGADLSRYHCDHLLETYGQVAKTFTLFAQRNWNVLADWDSELQSIAEEKDVAALWQELVERKNFWQYSDFFLFNEDCQFLTAAGRQGTQDNIRSAFLELYEKKEPCVSAYIASSGLRKIVFAIPLSEAFTLDGVTYTGVAVSYDNDVVERLLGEVIFDGESDCYIARVDGSILLSLEPETEFSEGMEDLFGFLEAKTMMPQEDQSRVQQDIAETKSGSAMCIYRGSKY